MQWRRRAVAFGTHSSSTTLRYWSQVGFEGPLAGCSLFWIERRAKRSKILNVAKSSNISAIQPDAIGAVVLAIVSEVAAVLSGRRGGFLRERKNDFHATNVVAIAGDAA